MPGAGLDTEAPPQELTMALTPEDVLNKTFTQTQFRRGYDEREVDDFLDDIVAEMRRMTKETDDLRGELNAVREGNGLAPVAARQEPDTSAGDLDELRSKNATLAARVSELESTRSDLTARLGEYEGKSGDTEARNAELQGQLAQLQHRGGELEAQAAEATARADELEAANAALQERATELETKVAQLEGELEASRNDLAAVQAEREQDAAARQEAAARQDAAAAEDNDQVAALRARIDEVEQDARLYRIAELRLIDRHEIDQLARAGQFQRLDRQNCGGLSQRLDLKHTGHDRPTGEMALEELLVEAHGLDRVNLLADLQRQHPVHQQQRIAVRQRRQYLRDVIGRGGRSPRLSRAVSPHAPAPFLRISVPQVPGRQAAPEQPERHPAVRPGQRAVRALRAVPSQPAAQASRWGSACSAR